MDLYSLLWASQNLYGTPRTSMDLYKPLWTCTNLYRSLRTSMDLYRPLWTSIDLCGLLRTSMDLYGFLWSSTNLCGPSRTSMDLYKRLRTSIKPYAFKISPLEPSGALWALYNLVELYGTLCAQNEGLWSPMGTARLSGTLWSPMHIK